MGTHAAPPGQIGLRQFRISKRESQATFWARFGVTQSSGSRFETGLGVPPPVAILIRLYLNGKLNDGDLLD
ncbi:MAG: helix-turn-helix domain-containing protein [Massilia sp.]|nr:helix-turn-helix domain-containing protein [Massilia sp.]